MPILLNSISKVVNQKLAQQLIVLYTLVLVLLVTLPINGKGSIINNTYVVSIRLDYLLHCAIFLPWMFLLRLVLKINFIKDSVKVLLWLIAGITFAFLLEFVQYLLPYRAFNINDLLANGLGVLLGLIFFIK